jgi:hypothetical protein
LLCCTLALLDSACLGLALLCFGFHMKRLWLA